MSNLTSAVTSAATSSTRTVVGTSRSRRVGLAAVVLAVAALLSACMSSEQQTAFDLVNDTRARAGVSTLAQDNTATAKAQAWAEHMAATNTLAHSNLASGMDGQWTRLAENVGYSGSIDGVHRAFMDSAGHRNNILDAGFTHLGVGVAQSHGRTWVALVFVRR